MTSQRPGMIRGTAALAVLLATGAGPALAAMELDEALRIQAYPPPPPTPAQVLIRNATVWTMTDAGIVEGMDVLLDKGKIVAIGHNLGARADALVIDGTGRHVTPGIIDAHSHSATELLDLNEGVNSISSEVRVQDVLDVRSAQIYQQLAGGSDRRARPARLRQHHRRPESWSSSTAGASSGLMTWYSQQPRRPSSLPSARTRRRRPSRPCRAPTSAIRPPAWASRR